MSLVCVYLHVCPSGSTSLNVSVCHHVCISPSLYPRLSIMSLFCFSLSLCLSLSLSFSLSSPVTITITLHLTRTLAVTSPLSFCAHVVAAGVAPGGRARARRATTTGGACVDGGSEAAGAATDPRAARGLMGQQRCLPGRLFVWACAARRRVLVRARPGVAGPRLHPQQPACPSSTHLHHPVRSHLAHRHRHRLRHH